MTTLVPDAPVKQAKVRTTMKALVYQGPGKKVFEDRPMPKILAPADAIVRITKTTICGTDLHILKGDVPTCKPGRILGHEGVGVVESVGAGVTTFHPGDRVLISCISSLRSMRILQEGDVLPLHDRRLDSRQRNRRHASRIRAHSARRHQPLSHPRRRRRGCAGDVERHPADRLRVRGAQRQSSAGRTPSPLSAPVRSGLRPC